MVISSKREKRHIGSANKWGLLPFNSEKISGKYLVVNIFGNWCILDEKEFQQFDSQRFKENSVLYKKLLRKGMLLTESNQENLINNYRNLNVNLFTGPYLHIAVVTERCNLKCKYCQTKKTKPSDMNIEVASRVLDFLAASKSLRPILEIQGGEPLLNWNAIEFLAKNFLKIKDKHDLGGIAIVTNLLFLDNKKLNFLIDHNVKICSSLDGPAFVHDKNRVFPDGKGTYNDVIKKIDMIRREYKRRGLKTTVGLLPTITKQSLPYHKEIVDEYLRLGQGSIAIRYANKLGKAIGSWSELGITAEEFCDFWSKSVDYIIELNKKGKKIFERTLHVMLNKILNKLDPRYVDMMNPCGAGRSVLTYNPLGAVYTCDEARMLDDDLFKLGNLLKDSYEEVMDSPVLVDTCKASLLELWDYSSPYKVWGGTCPVLNYAQQKTPVVKICNSEIYKIQKFQFRYIFKKIIEDEGYLTLFKKWVS